MAGRSRIVSDRPCRGFHVPFRSVPIAIFHRRLTTTKTSN
jgi:hypothetical protein